MTKRLVSVILAVLLLCALFGCDKSSETSTRSITSSLSEASSESEEIIDHPHVEYIPDDPNFTYEDNYFEDVPYVGLYNAKSLEAFYTESADARIYPASLTKMVTASVALKYGNLDDVYRVGSELDLVQPHSSLFGIRKGMELTLHDLLYGLLLPSGNDAAYTIAVNVVRGISGNENLEDIEAVEYFCRLMNEYCAEIGALNSHFTTPEGWDDDEQYTTVNDLAIIASRAMSCDMIAEVVKTPEIRLLIASGETFYISNSNLLIHE
ncbi:MAG: D-alanyl-D-alanine carboxypeptidase, partial [Clostridia bacterium]|nr:D-alanyl-D-alanine carboxypeptidase [Clostridia bacterium]